jgi:hypothetical protein
MRIREKGRDVLLGTGEQVVDAQDLVSIAQESLAQVRAEKTCPAGDEYFLSTVVVLHTFVTDSAHDRSA